MDKSETLVTEGELLAVVSALLLKASKFVMSAEERAFLDTADYALEKHVGESVDTTTSVLLTTATTISKRIVAKLWKDGHRSPVLRLLASQLDVTLSQQHGGGGDHRIHPFLLLTTALNIEMGILAQKGA